MTNVGPLPPTPGPLFPPHRKRIRITRERPGFIPAMRARLSAEVVVVVVVVVVAVGEGGLCVFIELEWQTGTVFSPPRINSRAITSMTACSSR